MAYAFISEKLRKSLRLGKVRLTSKRGRGKASREDSRTEASINVVLSYCHGLENYNIFNKYNILVNLFIYFIMV